MAYADGCLEIPLTGALLFAGESGQWEQIPLQISRNSNGYPIVTAGGKEYAMCN